MDEDVCTHRTDDVYRLLGTDVAPKYYAAREWRKQGRQRVRSGTLLFFIEEMEES